MWSLNNHKQFFELSGLISGFLAGTLSEKQSEKLNLWLDESEEHKVLFERICARQTVQEKMNCYLNGEVHSAFQNFLRHRRRLVLRRRIYQWTAACAVLGMVLGGWLQWYNIRPESVSREVLALEESLSDSMGRRPMLTLASGMRIMLPEDGLMLKETSEGQQVIAGGGFSEQYADTFSHSESVFNTVSVPPMCDFYFILSDGTKVWMNAASSLRYPVKFAADSRTIYVTGEVYLEVAKDAGRPFSVVVDGMRIEVLGTCFNVHAYPHERETRVTLAEGKVAAHVGAESYALVPGNQLYLKKVSGEAGVRTVDVDDVLAWKRGRYVFKKCSLEEVISTLRYWYDVEIVLKGELAAQTTYTGVVNKEEALEVFLERLEEVSDVKCVRQGNVVLIQ